ncbi:MAG: EAL domain-containing protein [Deltaproteobacteria bacterium]|nr:EAL domain-containing protein [Deltaproteobacteria bacterium]
MAAETTKVLLVEDDPSAATRTTRWLRDGPRGRYELAVARDLGSALARLREESFDAILLALPIPDAPGLEGLARIQNEDPKVPVIVVVEPDDFGSAETAVERGAADCLRSDERRSPALARSLRYAVERRRTAERLEFLTRCDPLTGLTNRPYFQERLRESLARTSRAERTLALFYVEIDDFKRINSTLGHAAGDAVLAEIGGRLRRELRPYDVLARIGGDEFGIVAEDVSEARDAARLAQRLCEVLQEPLSSNRAGARLTASVGIAIFPFDGNDAATLLRNAELAMYRAKRAGGAQPAFFAPVLGERIHEQLALEGELRRALAAGELVLHYQPLIDLQTGRLNGLEALVRWQHPTRGLLPPAAFLPLAEKTGLIVDVGEWILWTACTQRRAWQRDGIVPGRVAVNLSPRQLHGDRFVPTVASILERTGLPGALLEMEVAEDLLVPDDIGRRALTGLRKLGIRLSIDDFGTGYSSLAYLQSLPVDAVKIDQRFVAGLDGDHGSRVIVRAVISLAHELGLAVVGEGVETPKQLEFLREHGCDTAQGFLLCPPLPADEVPSWAPPEVPADPEHGPRRPAEV